MRALIALGLCTIAALLAYNALRERPRTAPAPARRAVDERRPTTVTAELSDAGSVAEPPPLAPLPEAPRPGRRVTVELTQAPLAEFRGELSDDASEVYGRILSSIRGLSYDPHLGRAARDLAFQHSFFAGTVPRTVLRFLLHSSGAIDKRTVEGYLATNVQGDKAIRERVRDLMRQVGSERVRVGIGETYLPGARLNRFVAVILSTHRVEIDPTPRRVDPGATWRLSGELPDGYSKPSALAAYPGREPKSVTASLRSSGSRFELELPTGNERGVLTVSVSGVGPFGPEPLLQLPVLVGRPIPRKLTVRIPPKEERLTPLDAEAKALRLLNGLRHRYRLGALTRDPKLDAVARGHSRDMKDSRFFGHRSPTTGAVGDRLGAVGYRSVAFAENVALASSIAEAHDGLAQSLGHRINLLHPRFSRVGIGVVRRNRASRRAAQWLLTQVFARPVRRLDLERDRSWVFERIADARRELGRELVLSRRLTTRAQRAVRRLTSDPAAFNDAVQGTRAAGGSWGWRLTTGDLRAFRPPDQVTQKRFTHAGIGLSQDEAGRVTLILILTAGPPRP